MDFDYIVADPTGNITVLITTPYEGRDREAMIREAFEKEPSCEQVGFIERVSDNTVRLEMMGYEFCGNATLSTAAWQAAQSGLRPGEETTVTVESSGADEPLDVRVLKHTAGPDADDGESIYSRSGFEGTVRMPVPEISSFRGYPLVKFSGIYHLLVPADDFTDGEAEAAVVRYSEELSASALGLMMIADFGRFTSGGSEVSDISMRPLVYVPGSDTLFWESGCATGSTAAGWYRCCSCGAKHTEIRQPGGIIRVDAADGQPMMTGNVIFRPGE